MNGRKAPQVGYDEAQCDCGQIVHGKLAGLRGTKMLRIFRCGGSEGCGRKWDAEIPDAMAATDRPNGNGKNGHHLTACPHCGHELKA